MENKADLAGLSKLNLDEICMSIDLETPSNHGAGIFSIGIVPFSLETGEAYPEFGFYQKADFTSVLNTASKIVDVGDTMAWWMKQGDTARKEVLGYSHTNERNQDVYTKQQTMHDMVENCIAYMHALADCLRTNGILRPVGNSDLFDVGIFENTVRACGMSVDSLPYRFWNTLDLRTAVYLTTMVTGIPVKKRRKREGTHHNALDDANMQALWFIDAFQFLKGDKT